MKNQSTSATGWNVLSRIAGGVAALMLIASPALAMDTFWDVAGPSDWSTGGNWNNGEPSAADNAFVNNGGTATISAAGEVALALDVAANGGETGFVSMTGGGLAISGVEAIGRKGVGTFTQSAGTHTIGSTLHLGKDLAAASGTYNLSGTGSLDTTGNVALGEFGTGTFNQSGGTHTVSGSDFFFGSQAGGTGIYDLSAGTLTVSGFEWLGSAGTGTFTQSGGTHTVSSLLYMGAGSGNTGTYTLSAGDLAVNANEYIGNSSNGDFIQTGGTNTTPNLVLGVTAGGNGTYDLSAGALSVGISEEHIGSVSTGVFTQSGGTHTVNSRFYLGTSSSGDGTYNLSGTGSLAPTGNQYIGYFGAGTFNQTGGTNTVPAARNLFIGNFASGTGNYNLSAGTLTTPTEWIGTAGTGTITQSGGTHTVTGIQYLGAGSGNTGTYNLSGGDLVVNGNQYVGNSSNGDFIQTGGTNSPANLVLGVAAGSNGTYDLSAGTLSVGINEEHIGSASTGVFTQSGGTHTVNSRFYLGTTFDGNGTYNLSGTGSLAPTDNEYVGNLGTGTFNQTGGTNTVPAGFNLFLGNSASGTGNYNLSAGTLTAPTEWVGNAGTGTFTQTGGTHTVSTVFYLGAGGTSGTYNFTGGTLTGGAQLIVRVSASSAGTFQGHGTVGLTSEMVNNGRVIADGDGAELTLDFTSAAAVTSDIENTTTNGWFAVEKGKLTLPSAVVGNGVYNWGENPADADIDLVNSMQLLVSGILSADFDENGDIDGADFLAWQLGAGITSGATRAEGDADGNGTVDAVDLAVWESQYAETDVTGTLQTSLLSTDRSDVSAGLINPIGVWDVDTISATPGFFDGSGVADMTIRYDDALTATLGVTEANLNVYQFTGGNWVDITTGIDTVKNQISADGITSFSQFAVAESLTALTGTTAVPEPTTLILVTIAILFNMTVAASHATVPFRAAQKVTPPEERVTNSSCVTIRDGLVS
jgi:lipopolysaccharide export system protein LptA